MEKFLSKFWSLLFIFIISIPTIFYLSKPGFFPIHDETQVARVEQMAKSLKEGQFPVRWVADLGYGYGYPIYNFYNPLPYYVGGFFNIIGFDPLVSTKLMFAIGCLLAGMGMYWLAGHYFGELGGVLAALFYMYAPYHAVQMYIRGSVAEFWAYGILPFVILGIIKKKVVLSGIFLGLLILSHNLTVLMVLPLILILMAIRTLSNKWKKISIGKFAITILLALGLSCFFWLPSLYEKKYTTVDQMVKEKFNPLLHFVYPEQLWNPHWGFGGSAPGPIDGMSFQIGKLHILLTILSFFAIFYFWKKNRKKSVALFLGLILLLWSIFMMLPISAFIWQIFSPPLLYLQFPWRFLTLTALSSSFLAGGTILVIRELFEKKKIFVLLWFSVLLTLLLFLNIKYFVPKYIYATSWTDLVTKEKLNWDNSVVSDEYLPPNFQRPKDETQLFVNKFNLEYQGKISPIKTTAVFYNLQINTSGDNKLTINTVDFPGWQAWIDGKPIAIDSANDLINLIIPAGNNAVIVKFTNTPIRTIANIVSLLTLLFLVAYIYWKKNYFNKNDR